MLADELEQGFRDLFRDFMVAGRSLAAYPSGHPVVVSGIAAAQTSIDRLLERSGPIKLTASRDALHFGERVFSEPAPARIATLLRRRRAGSLSLSPGATARELERLLAALSLEPRLARSAGSLARELVEAGVQRLVVADLDFSTLVLVEGDANEAEEDLWVRVARRLFRQGALAPERVDAWLAAGGTMATLLQSMLARGSGPDGTIPDPSALAGAGAGAGAGSVSGSVTAATESRVIAAAVAAFTDTPGADVKDLGELTGWLQPTAREQLARELERSLATRADGDKTLASFFAALSPEIASSLQPILQRSPVSAGRGATDPAHALRLRRTLATADIDILLEAPPELEASELLLELVGDEPQGSGSADAALEGELEAGGIARAVAASLLELAEREETSETALVNLLARVEAAYRSLLAAGRVRLAFELVERIQRRARRDTAAAAHFRRTAERLSSRESIGVLVRSLAELPPEAVRVACQLVERLGPTAARHLLGLLAESEDRDQRRRLLDLLAELGPLVVRDATTLLGDPRWYVVRNVLLLLRRVGDPGSLPAVRKCAEHPDLRVRLEAIRNLFAFDQELPRELLRQAFVQRDPRLAGEAIDLAGEHRMVEASELLVDLLARRDPFGTRRAVRLKAIRALADIGDPTHLDRLRRFGARFTLLRVAKEERIEFFRSLSAYPAAAIASWISRGRRSPDPEVRKLAGDLDRSAQTPSQETIAEAAPTPPVASIEASE